MLIRTLRPCAVQGREARAFACVDLPEGEAQALIDAGDAEPWAPAERAPMSNPYAAPSEMMGEPDPPTFPEAAGARTQAANPLRGEE